MIKDILLKIQELRKEFELENKVGLIEQSFIEKCFYDVIGDGEFGVIEFVGVKNENAQIRISMSVNKEVSHNLVVKLNNITIFNKSFACENINEIIPFVMDQTNKLELFLFNNGSSVEQIDISLIGKIGFVENAKDIMFLNKNNEVINVKDGGKNNIYQKYSSVENLISKQIMNANALCEVMDCKEVKCTSSGTDGVQNIMLCKDENNALFMAFEDGRKINIGGYNFSGATIIPINHEVCSIIIVGVLDGSLIALYFDFDFNLLVSEKLIIEKIGKVKKVSSLIDYSNGYSNVVISVVDAYNNCYLLGMFGYATDCTSLKFNMEPFCVGKFVGAICYMVGNKMICYFQKSQNVFVKMNFYLDYKGGAYYFTKSSSCEIKNVNKIFNLNGVEVALKNGNYEVLSEDNA